MTTARPSDMESIARQMFAGYISHYHANPYFDRNEFWTATRNGPLRKPCRRRRAGAWLLETRGDVVGFSCTQTTPFSGEIAGSPERRASGETWARRLSGYAPSAAGAFQSGSSGRFVIATQAHNTAVQRVWTREGLLLQRARRQSTECSPDSTDASPHAPAVPDEVPKSPSDESRAELELRASSTHCESHSTR